MVGKLLDFETTLVDKSLNDSVTNDPEQFEVMSFSKFQTEFPHFNWTLYFKYYESKNYTFDLPRELNVSVIPKLLPIMKAVLDLKNAEVINEYLRFKFLFTISGMLPDK